MPDAKQDYEQARIAIDAVIFTIDAGELHVLLHEREKEPFHGRFELLGGLLQHGESADQTLARKLREQLGAKGVYLEQFHTFTEPGRDPRTRTVSIGFLALVPEADAPGLSWHSLGRLPPLAFDHKQIILTAHEHLKGRLDSQLVRHFLPGTFPLNRLQAVYEAVLGAPQDNRNFRKKMIASGTVLETKERERGVSHRPAILYRFA